MMNTNHNVSDDLLVKYLSENTNTDENLAIEEWRNEPANNEHYLYLKKEWEMLHKSKPVHVDVDKAWSKLHSRIVENPDEKKMALGIYSYGLLKIAAAIAVFLVLSIGIWQVVGNQEQSIKSMEQQNMLASLADESQVYLNSFTELKVSNKFNKELRNVELTGEAFFDVAPNPEKPFVIQAKNTSIQVLGTSFTVNTKLPNDQVQVVVKSGTVRFYNAKNEIILTAGETGIFQNGTFIEETNKDANFDAWHTRKLYFNEHQLTYVLNTLAKVYQVQIRYDKRVTDNYKLSGTYAHEDLKTITATLDATFPLAFSYNNDKRILTVE